MVSEERVAYVETVGTDMGTAGSYCSNCGYDLTSQEKQRMAVTFRASRQGGIEELLKKDNLGNCPECKLTLQRGTITPYPFGGSDF